MGAMTSFQLTALAPAPLGARGRWLRPMSRKEVQMSASNNPVFTHHRLEVYPLALRRAALTKAVADRIPHGYRSYADHLKRASGNTVLLIGEGANRYNSGMKRQRYEGALGGEPLHPARAAKRAEERRTGR